MSPRVATLHTPNTQWDTSCLAPVHAHILFFNMTSHFSTSLFSDAFLQARLHSRNLHIHARICIPRHFLIFASFSILLSHAQWTSMQQVMHSHFYSLLRTGYVLIYLRPPVGFSWELWGSDKWSRGIELGQKESEGVERRRSIIRSLEEARLNDNEMTESSLCDQIECSVGLARYFPYF